MPEAQIRAYGEKKAFRPQTVERWLGWRDADREALFRLAHALKPSENHLRDLMDWLEEVALRDGSAIDELLSRGEIGGIESNPRLGRADKLKRIKEQIRRWRFPRLAETEDGIWELIRKLKLQPEVRLLVPVGLEGGTLRVEFSAASAAQLKRAVARLAEAADRTEIGAIFALLAGESAGSQTPGKR